MAYEKSQKGNANVKLLLMRRTVQSLYYCLDMTVELLLLKKHQHHYLSYSNKAQWSIR